MPDDEKPVENPTPTENSIPPSLQEPTADAPIPPIDPELAEVPPEALESSPNDFSVKSNDISPSDSVLIPEEAIPVEPTETPINPTSSEPNEPPVILNPEPVETQTAQIPPNEPLTPKPETKIEPNIQEIKPEPASVSNSRVESEEKPEPKLEKVISIPVIVSNKNKIFELLAKAKNAIQFRKRKKLDRVMTLFLKKSKITNDEVEKFLHVSDATATRYLSQLEKENKIKQVGKTGHAVSYSRI